MIVFSSSPFRSGRLLRKSGVAAAPGRRRRPARARRRPGLRRHGQHVLQQRAPPGALPMAPSPIPRPRHAGPTGRGGCPSTGRPRCRRKARSSSLVSYAGARASPPIFSDQLRSASIWRMPGEVIADEEQLVGRDRRANVLHRRLVIGRAPRQLDEVLLARQLREDRLVARARGSAELSPGTAALAAPVNRAIPEPSITDLRRIRSPAVFGRHDPPAPSVLRGLRMRSRGRCLRPPRPCRRSQRPAAAAA